jgi:enamine deaminase RidA (YjgF/YER057c/UK114 family)
MSTVVNLKNDVLIGLGELSQGEREELIALGMLGASGKISSSPQPGSTAQTKAVGRKAVTAHNILNEAYDYGSAFSRGLSVDLGSHSLILISGTASVSENGATVHPGDFRAQCWRTYRNITELLRSEGATWHDVVKCTCYLRDIERDYAAFNAIRTAFFDWLKLDPLPASVGIQARLCRPDLLVEIEAMAIRRK